ncbi:MAG: DUF5785 family protein [Haloarculaceae archaeon]
MDWPHDPDGEEGSEGRRKYGHAVLAKKVDEDEDFPLSASEFVEEYGDHPVRIDYETVVSVADVFEHVDGEEFEDFPQFHRAVGDALRGADYWPIRLEHA